MQVYRPDKKRRLSFSANAALFIGGTLIIIAGLILIFEAGVAKIHG